MKSISQEEKKFLKSYNMDKYKKPAVTADIVAFSLHIQDTENYRQNPENTLSILLVKRGNYPFKNMWALPGGFAHEYETIEECACRESTEETGFTPSALLHIGVFSKPNRDPRGWVISNAYLSITNKDLIATKGGDDAVDAKWFDVSFKCVENEIYILTLKNDSLTFSAKLKKIVDNFGKTEFVAIEDDYLAFDHAEIIAMAIAFLRKNVEGFELIFDFLPEQFTLSELKEVQEIILDKPILSANFRRKIANYVTETENYTSGAGHRPAKLFTKRTL